MLTPTRDKDLFNRLVQMFDNAADCFEWTDSKKVIHARHEKVVLEILKEIEKRGYRIGLPHSAEGTSDDVWNDRLLWKAGQDSSGKPKVTYAVGAKPGMRPRNYQSESLGRLG